MTFLSALALAIAALVAAPYLAHRLRRQRAEEKPFAAARLVPPTPPKARSRARLEDKSLFAIRAAAVVALALLGASPLVRCSRLALSRSGASVAVAIVLDDSMSMRAAPGGGRSRFDRAKEGADEILASLREGDAAAIVLAGKPARVGLAATTDTAAARAALAAIEPADRATDLDGAVAIAQTLVADLPQVDRRLIVLSDLADGNPDGPPVGEGADLPVWVAIPELAAEADDCAVLAADRAGGRARVRFACSRLEAAAGREVRIMDGDKAIAKVPLPETAAGEASVLVGGDEAKELFAELTGTDAIRENDRALVIVEAGPAALAVAGRGSDLVATGGAPIVEQALSALHVDMAVRPIPQPPDRPEDAAPFAAVIIDDPPGFTPEQRRALAAFVERGGMVMVALGPAAGAAPLGANFEPFLSRGVTFAGAAPPGANVATGASFFGEAVASLADVAPQGRAKIAEQDVAGYERLLDWADGEPMMVRQVRGRGEIWLSTLPFSTETSDFALRPGFLAVLDAFVSEARGRAAPRRGDVGVPWTFAGARTLEGEGPGGPVVPVKGDSAGEGVLRLVPSLAGVYRLKVDGVPELRVAAPLADELDFRPRRVAPGTMSAAQGGGVAIVDVSWIIALLLLALVAAEIVARALAPPRGEAA
jgi:hypothetical protein